MNPARYLPRAIPEPLEGLATLALDLRWTWNDGASALWARLDPQLWRALENPWLILETVSQQRLDELSRDPVFLGELRRQLEKRDAYLRRTRWWSGLPRAARAGQVAFFSMEYGLSEALPIYSGGLGILAGDYLKTASDLGVPVVGVGLLYQLGYFRQALDRRGEQLAFFPYNDPTMLPAVPLRDARGEWLHVTLQLPGRALRLRSWKVEVGRVALYLLDTNDPLNVPGDRGIAGELYGGDHELRLQQELALGIGGWRLLEALGVRCGVCHLNEGHTAFALLERARSFMKETGLPFPAALRCLRAGNLFTTHTAVAAGFDRYRPDLVAQYLGEYARELGIETRELLALGRAHPEDDSEPFNMAYLAMRGCGQVNAVSQVHETVSKGIFQPLFPRWPEREVPVGHVTNGVHVPSWDSGAADAIWCRSCGEDRWLGDLTTMEERFRCLPDEELWRMRSESRRALLEFVCARAARQGAAREQPCARLPLDPDALTLGFARRFATYKRPNLLLHDRARLTRLLTAPGRPVQLVIAGKAHPRDAEGKRLVHEWVEYVRDPEIARRAVFLEDYDMALATQLVQGVDLWVNTPRRPWEACGTSGMKVLVNGGLNLSELDGWWAEAYAPEVGWALGDLREHGDDPAYDAWEAEALYTLLEREVVPSFYERDGRGVPKRWVARMRESMALLTPRFSANRMVREYVERYYLGAAERCRERCGDGGKLGLALERWERTIAGAWRELRFGALAVDRDGEDFVFDVELLLGGMDPGALRVELYADPAGDRGPERLPMQVAREISGGLGYRGRAPAVRPASEYTPRVVPHHPSALPMEVTRILWYR